MRNGDDGFDLVVIGGGTAGLVTAAGAAGLGARTALVERDRLGGDCLWTGCVPSKALIGSARIAQAFRDAAAFGLRPADPAPDGARVLESARGARARIQPHDDPSRFRAMGVDVVEGEGRFASPSEVEVGGRRLHARRFVIATGSRPAVPPIDGLEETGYFTNETAFDRTSLPASVAIVGGGPIGVEFAQAYRRLGIQVTVVEMAARLLPREEPELSDRLRAILEGAGVRVLTGRRAKRAERRDGKAVLILEEPAGMRTVRGAAAAAAGPRSAAPGPDAVVAADEILVAAGRRPAVEGLGLDAAGVRAGRDGIEVDGKLRTSQRHIFAAGDVTGGLLFTHVADHEARTVVQNALFPLRSRISYDAVPWCTFTDPELAHVGLTEEEARGRHGDAVSAHAYDVSALDRAITDRAARGVVKLVVGRRGRILGGHILAADAGTMIVEVALAMKHGIPIGKLSELVHPYPTMSEGVRRAADAYRRGLLTGWRRRLVSLGLSLGRRLPP